MLKDFWERFLSWLPIEFLRFGSHSAPLVRYRLTELDVQNNERAARPGDSRRAETTRRRAGHPAMGEPVPSEQDRATSPRALPVPERAPKPPVKAADPGRPARSQRVEAAANRAITLQNVSVEFLYQPKIDLRKGQLAGVEILPQLRHPAMGSMTPTEFLSQASEAERRQYGMLAIRAAVSGWKSLQQTAFNVPFSTGVPVDLIAQPGIVDLLRTTRPDDENWPGLVLELSMSELMPALPVLQAVAHELRQYNVHFALNGLRLVDLLDPALRALPVAEIKLWNSFVMRAEAQPILTNACRTLVNYAHAAKANAVVAGLEQDGGLVWANTLGFDIGQGDLLAAPMPHARLVAMLR